MRSAHAIAPIDRVRSRGAAVLALIGLAVLALNAGCGSGAPSSSPSEGGGSGRSLYVAAQHAGEIDRFDAATLERTAVWTIGGDPHVLAWDPAQKLLWVSSPKANTLRAVDPTSGRVISTVPILQPDGLALVPGSGTLLVTSGTVGPGHLTLVDTVSKAVVGEVPVGSAPHAIAVSGDGRRAYVTDQYSNDVAVVDLALRRVVSTIPLDGTPYFVVLHGSSLYVSRAGNGKVSVVDAGSGRTTREFQLPTGIAQLAVSTDGSKLYVAVRGLAFSGFPNGNVGSTVAVIDLVTGASLDIKVPPGPDAVLLDRGSLLTTGLGQGTVSRVDLGSGAVTTATAGSFPTSVTTVDG